MRTLGPTLCLAAVTFLAIAGCDRHDDYDDAMPEASGYTLELTGEENMAPDGLGTSKAALSGQEAVGQTLQRTKEAVEALNAGIHQVMDPLAALIGSDDFTLEGAAHVYVFDRDTTRFRFAIVRIAARRFGWKLEAKPAAAADSAYVSVMAGALARGELARRGRGIIGFDLSNLASVDPSFHGSGQLLVAFAHVAGHKVLRFALKEFSSDVTQWDPVSALFSGWRGPLGGTDVRVASYSNIPETSSSAKELGLMHARWRADLGGRVTAVAAGGDVPANHAIVSFACYRVNDPQMEGYLHVTDCDGLAQSCSPIETTGALTNCLPEFQTDEIPNTDPNLAPLPLDAPEDPGVPSAMPSGT